LLVSTAGGGVAGGVAAEAVASAAAEAGGPGGAVGAPVSEAEFAVEELVAEAATSPGTESIPGMSSLEFDATLAEASGLDGVEEAAIWAAIASSNGASKN